jgi:hypothetical protein
MSLEFDKQYDCLEPLVSAKTAALKEIHRLCNKILHQDDKTYEDWNFSTTILVKEIRHIAGQAYPKPD